MSLSLPSTPPTPTTPSNFSTISPISRLTRPGTPFSPPPPNLLLHRETETLLRLKIILETLQKSCAENSPAILAEAPVVTSYENSQGYREAITHIWQQRTIGFDAKLAKQVGIHQDKDLLTTILKASKIKDFVLSSGLGDYSPEIFETVIDLSIKNQLEIRRLTVRFPDSFNLNWDIANKITLLFNESNSVRLIELHSKNIEPEIQQFLQNAFTPKEITPIVTINGLTILQPLSPAKETEQEEGRSLQEQLYTSF